MLELLLLLWSLLVKLILVRANGLGLVGLVPDDRLGEGESAVGVAAVILLLVMVPLLCDGWICCCCHCYFAVVDISLVVAAINGCVFTWHWSCCGLVAVSSAGAEVIAFKTGIGRGQ